LGYGGLVILLFIILIAMAGDICIRILKRTSHLVVVEFVEMEELQNVLLAVSRIAPVADNYLISGDPALKQLFQEKIGMARNRVTSCSEILTERHDRSCLDSIAQTLNRVDSLGSLFFGLYPENHKPELISISTEMERVLDRHLHRLGLLLEETKHEVDRYVSLNETAIVHSTATIISLGSVLVLGVIFGGLFFIHKITAPSRQLLQTMQLVARGDIKAKVPIHSRDEFGAIAEAFNLMMERLDQITVSKNRYTNILNSMFEAVIVTDRSETITAVNKQACILLESGEERLMGARVTDYFCGIDPAGDSSHSILSGIHEKKTEIGLKSGRGNVIPVEMAVTDLLETDSASAGYVVVIQDLSEKKKIEAQMEEIRKERSIAIHEAQENERLRLATDLHDGIIQMLTSVIFSVQNLNTELTDKGYDAHHELSRILDQIHSAISESRRISHDLMPPALHDLGLVPALNQLVKQLNHQHRIQFRFAVFNMVQRADPRIEKALYRICQESVSNILKHSQAKNAYIQLIFHTGSVVLVIEDDGIGFEVEESDRKSSGIGLESVRKRVETFRGTLTIRSAVEQGTELLIEIPCI